MIGCVTQWAEPDIALQGSSQQDIVYVCVFKEREEVQRITSTHTHIKVHTVYVCTVYVCV